jgi:hypothetical protein
MHKNRQRINAPSLSDDYSRELSLPPSGITQIVVDAVAQYNEMLPLLEHFERKGDERLIKEEEEKATKNFLDGILDIMQQWNR